MYAPTLSLSLNFVWLIEETEVFSRAHTHAHSLNSCISSPEAFDFSQIRCVSPQSDPKFAFLTVEFLGFPFSITLIPGFLCRFDAFVTRAELHSQEIHLVSGVLCLGIVTSFH